MAIKALHSVVAVVGIAAVSGAAWWYQSKPKGPVEATGPGGTATAAAGGASAPRAPAVEVAKVEVISLRDDAQTVGTLRSRQGVMLRPEVAGRIQSIGFGDGARVRRGQVLVQLDDTLQRAEVKQAAAQVSLAQANYKRNQELVAQNFVAQRVLEESAASLQVAEAQQSLACARLERMRLVAPFDGTVGIRNINIGDFVKDGADLVNIEDIGTMYVDFRLPERFQTRVRNGQEVELQIDALPGRMFRARVEAIDPQIDANGRSIAVRALLPNTPGEALVQGPRGGGAPGARPAAAPASGAAAAQSGAKPAAAAPARWPAAMAARGGASAARGAGASGAGERVAGGQRSADGCPPPRQADTPLSQARQAGVAPGSGPLRPGMFARVTAVFSVKERALVIPEEAIVPQAGRQFVIKVVAPSAVPGTATAALSPDVTTVSKRTEVKLGVRRPGRVEILEGVEEGDTVVIAGQQRLQRDGTPVRVIELGRPGGGASGPRPAASGPGTSP